MDDDHDQRFKTLLREFLPEFFALFFPRWAARLDFAGTEWLEQEAFLDPPGGDKRILDVVAKVPTTVIVPNPAGHSADSTILVINVEVESGERATEIRGRMLEHYWFLRKRHGLPVVPVCLFLQVGLEGLGWDTYEERLWGRQILSFDYAYIGLPALDAADYLHGDSVLGLALAALMNVPSAERGRIKAEGLARIAASRENDVRKELLAECFDNYLKLDLAERMEFDRVLAQQPTKGATMVVSRWRQEGRQEALRDTLRVQLAQKFGPLSQEVDAWLVASSADQFAGVLARIIAATSFADLRLTETPATEGS